MTTAILGPMAFMPGFSFSIAATRFKEVRDLSRSDANIAGTLYLRADFLPDGDAPRARSLIREYLEMRHELVVERQKERLPGVLRRSREIQQEFWDLSVRAKKETGDLGIDLLITVLHDLIDNDLTRQAKSPANRLPCGLWFPLLFLAALATAVIGISSGLHGRRSRLAGTALIVAFSLVFVLIIDLDRRFRSLFHRNDPATEATLESMREG